MDKRKAAQAHCQQHRRREPDAELVRNQETAAKRRRRANLSPADQQREREQNTLKKCLARANLSPAKQQQKREQNTLQKHLARNNCHTLPMCCEALYFAKDYPLEADIGQMDVECYHCGALHFQEERTASDLDQFTSCCHKGAVTLPPLLPFPNELKLLFLRNHLLSKTFFEHIRKYNGATVFASVVSNNELLSGRGPYAYKISEQIYHFLGPAQPSIGDVPIFEQLYFLETADAQACRSNNPVNVGLDSRLLSLLDLTLRQVQQEEHDIATEQGCQPLEVQMIFENDHHLDQRRYNTPHVNEVAAIFVGPEEHRFPSHCLAVHPRSNQLKTIPVINADCDPMSYPMLFPRGDKGWHPKIINNHQNQTRRTYVSILQFYCYRMAQRNSFNPILYAGALFQQYLVDAYVKVESTRLNYQRQNQKTLRAKTYCGLSDYLAAAAEERGAIVGRAVVLSSSFPGGPRAMRQSYQDAMAICRAFAAALNSQQAQDTMLTAWFKLNEQDTDATFTFAYPGAKSFADLRTVQVYLYEDFIRSYNVEVALFLAYENINNKLAQFHKSLDKNYHIPSPGTHTNVFNTNEQINKDQEYEIGQRMYIQLNDAQQLIPNRIIAALLHLGNGTLPSVNEEIEVPEQCISTNNLVDDVFGSAIESRDETILLSTKKYILV
ncbi:17755_t:CDS:2 [Dentiscutata erythropus]|uniref:17755_t:CDS:1 n=1 Tax=Dentiscutata erythropus TaxID=1348616 RepID=A0A9N9HK21_9GLOM|nr:17755_t:CDS:2 [Dentiscutata erythropus]